MWEIRGTSLSLISPSGQRMLPSVEEIYRALVERQPTESWIPTKIDELRASRYPLQPAVNIEVGHDGIPVYSLEGSAKRDSFTLTIADLERRYTIASGTWYPIDPAMTAEVLQLMQSAGAQPGPATSLRSYLALRKAAEKGGPVIDRTANLSLSPLAFPRLSSGGPAGVQATLYSYQLAGWRWLKFLVEETIGGVLADEMGLGKTLQVISALRDPGERSVSPALIIAPGSLLENWRREVAKFAPDLRVLKHHGPMRTGRPAELQNYDAIITSYDNAVTDNGLLTTVHWKVVVLDEAQYIRNPNAQRTKAIKRLHRDVGLAVTGTPVQNRLLDLWSLFDFVLPGYLGDLSEFSATYPDDATGAARLESVVSPLILRRRVSEVARDLPPRIDIPQFLDLEPEEAAAYDAERDRIYAEYGAAATLVALTSLRRFCAHPSLMDGTSTNADPMSFAKFRRLHEILEEVFANGEKVLVFTSFTKMADLIARHAADAFHVFVGVLDGRLAIEDREPLLDRFRACQGPAALVLNPQAGGTGLNITAANHVIHYNPEWNPAVEDQASARAYRRGQELPVTVHRLIVAGTVEEVVDTRLTRKRALAETAVIGIEGMDSDYDDIVVALSTSPSKR